MSGARGRRLGIAALLVLLAVAPVLALAPAAPGAVRVAGVSLLWWYTALIAPLAATALTIAILVRDGERARGRSRPSRPGCSPCSWSRSRSA